MSTNRLAFLAAGILAAILTPASRAQFSIDWFTIDGGGGTSSGGGFEFTGTIGQPDAGTHAAGGFSLEGGFWSIVSDDAGGCVADFNEDGNLNIFDFLAFQSAFGSEDPRADLAAPFGTLNIFDYLAYLTAFGNGC